MTSHLMRPTGHLRDPAARAIGARLTSLRLPASQPPKQWSNRYLVPAGYNQVGNSCLGASYRHAAIMAAKRVNVHLDPSALAPYAVARQLQYPAARVLQDIGTYPYLMLTGLQKFGYVSRARWPETVSPRDTVPIDVFEAGSLARLTGTYRITDDPRQRGSELRAAISAGHGVVMGMDVGEVFMAGTEALYVGEGSYVGGHAMVIVGYRPGAYELINSWGQSWCDNGYVWVSESYIHEQMFDGTVVTVAPSKVY